VLRHSFLGKILPSFRVFRAFRGRNDPNDLSTSDFGLRGIDGRRKQGNLRDLPPRHDRIKKDADLSKAGVLKITSERANQCSRQNCSKRVRPSFKMSSVVQ
jgi:hypothetical protein